ncbi:alkylation response protein AidB-like acyl-CoA dehydrogenase [Mycetocola sp. BIGb0189]|uniref:acyl-CoA dehydrogenase family protein n=1 Tax=Mycetocola sp. BIGb0189 TaxID=2940604 RepID=UPI00216A11A5|nr:acyl-CoA dehydrogenase family protein [Mycetocola sp. BIGb0189]MCS4276561.1 alkylation response protein AidB-like acyl-CoA dehydrogenase [Mycetocola sp. BIGb0189]
MSHTINPEFIALAEATRDALANIALDGDESGEYAAAREILENSGLLALRIPAALGGPGASQVEITEVFRILAQADPGIAQLLQPHYGFTDAVVMLGSDEARERLYADIRAGKRIANAAAERGGRHAADFSTVFTRQEDGSYLASGQKFYATGSLGAAWITVMAVDGEGSVIMSFIPTDAPGLEIIDDWSGMGQRGSGSGTLRLSEVAVPADFVFAWSPATRPTAWAEAGRLAHAAIDVGIAEGALRYGVASVRASNRVPFELAQYASLVEDPILRFQVGKESAAVRAVAALLRETAAVIDRAEATPDAPESLLTEVREGLLATKALSADVSNRVATELFSWTGARTADRSLRADRFWRNARTHTLHDPVRLRYADLGQIELNR